MTIEKFEFKSPSVQVRETDNSRLPNAPTPVGPTIIGRALRGPALRPVEVRDAEELEGVFGPPSPGARGGDVWREGNLLAPTFGMYAAQAWLRFNPTLNFVRVLGASHIDATTDGVAGWKVGDAPTTTQTAGGSYGLFIIDSGSSTSALTGTLGAIFYLSEGSIELSGTDRAGNTAQTGTALMVQSQGTDKEFKALIKDGSGNIKDTISFNFNRNSKKFIREVFNTNPTLLNTRITRTAQQKTYFLGESFERSVADNVTGSSAGGQFGFILALASGSAAYNIQEMDSTPPETNWFVSQHLGDSGSFDLTSDTSVTRLFKIKGLEGAEWEMRNYKVSIANIKVSPNPDVNPYGTFDVLLRRVSDSDGAPEIVEQFSNVSLNPFDDDYIAKRIGDSYSVWDDRERRYRVYGNHPNASRYIRVEMNPDVDAGATNPILLPFGVLGPVRFKGFTILSGSDEAQDFGTTTDGSDFTEVFAQGNADIVGSKADANTFVNVGSTPFTGSFVFPSVPTRANSKTGDLVNGKEAFFGASTTRTASDRVEPGYADLVRKLPSSLTADPDGNSSLDYHWTFSLDDLVQDGATDAVWTSGSRVAGTSFTAVSGTYEEVLEQGFNRFTSPLWGGFDGVDITERDPFANALLDGKNQTTSAEYNSVKRAIDSVKDKDVIITDLLSMPGLTNTSLTDHLIRVVEERADALGIIDVEGGFIPSTENSDGDASSGNRGSVASVVSNAKTRRLNTTWASADHPWLQYEDNGVRFWGPPSIARVGAISNTKRRTQLWFAPAGFNRGGLTQGAAGIRVTNVRERLNKEDRDDLYEVSVNPIANFPNEGIVIMGQKTLSAERKATDRINVRLLSNFLRRRLEEFGRAVLFDPNIEVTWNRFLARAEPFLDSVKARFGLEDYRLVLDRTTTTADLRDRNIAYAKAIVIPTKSIENFAIDFVIVNSGADLENI